MSYIRTESHRKRMRENNPMKDPKIAKKSADALRGIKRSLKTKLKISEVQKGKHHSPSTEFKKGVKFGPMPKLVKEKISLSLMGHKGANKGKKTHPCSDETKAKIKIARAKQIITIETKRKISESHINNPNRKFKKTIIENLIEEELIKRNIVYIPQTPLCKVSVVDFYLPEYHIAIECDGCFYHACPAHGHKDYHQDRPDIDRKKDAVLTFNGFNVYRFWEHEIKESAKKCIDSLNIK